LFVDAQGVAHVTYDAYTDGRLKFATWDGKLWSVDIADFRGHTNDQWNLGMGNSLTMDQQGQAYVSYYDSGDLKCAWQLGKKWRVDTVDSISARVAWMGYRSSIALDSHGNPHIAYEDAGTLKHAFWDGTKWHTETIAARGADNQYRFASLAIGADDAVYISYRDPNDGSLQVAIGRPGRWETQNGAKLKP